MDQPEGENNLSLKKRRESERFPVDAHVFILIDKQIKKGMQLADISSGGLSGFLDYPLKVDEEVEVTLLHPFFDDFVKRRARVARTKEARQDLWEAGLDFRFEKIDLENYKRLNYPNYSAQ